MKIPLLIVTLLVLAACTAHQSGMEIASEESFVANMIPHHQEAVDTSRIVLESTENPAVRDLATRIIEAQTQEIDMMQGWLSWYSSPPTPMYMKMMPDLQSLDGQERDEAYLRGMIDHHKMAVKMAEDVLKLDPRPEVREFAQGVINVQTAEIAEMEQLLQ